MIWYSLHFVTVTDAVRCPELVWRQGRVKAWEDDGNTPTPIQTRLLKPDWRYFKFPPNRSSPCISSWWYWEELSCKCHPGSMSCGLVWQWIGWDEVQERLRPDLLNFVQPRQNRLPSLSFLTKPWSFLKIRSSAVSCKLNYKIQIR